MGTAYHLFYPPAPGVVKVGKQTMKRSNFNHLSEPCEILYNKGKSGLSDYHLIAAIGDITVEKAREILAMAEFRLSELAKWDLNAWLKIEGIGVRKASALVTSFELARRRLNEEPVKRVKISSPAQVHQYMKPYFLDELVEHFYILLLSRNTEVIKLQKISSGGTSSTTADQKVIFKKALDHLASSIILIHNHPSGNRNPSEADRKLTAKLKEAGKYLDIPVLDHIIFTESGYFSFADEGFL